MSPISRRRFAAVCGAAAAGAFAGLPKTAKAGWQDYIRDFFKDTTISPQIKIDGDFNLFLGDVRFPVMSWQWFAANISMGVLQSLGGIVFSSFVSAAFGQRSIEELLQQQLVAIAEIVDQKLQENDLRNYNAKIASMKVLMTEYVQSPSHVDRLNTATTQSSDVVELTKSLGYLGYQSFTSAAGMRLAVLQEREKRDSTEGQNILTAKRQYIAFHNALDIEVDDRTSKEYYVNEMSKVRRRGGLGRPAQLEDYPIKKRIYGIAAEGRIRDVDWADVRRQARERTTFFGEKIIELWGAKRVPVDKVVVLEGTTAEGGERTMRRRFEYQIPDDGQ